jgi:hypothetical protein
LAAVVPQESAVRRRRITVRDATPADEEIDIAVAIEIGRGNHAAGDSRIGQRCFRRLLEPALAVVQVKAVAERQIAGDALHAAGNHIEILIPVAIGVDEDAPDPHTPGLPRNTPGDGPGTPVGTGSAELAGRAGGPAHVDFLRTIAVDIRDRQAWTELGELPGQQWFALEIVISQLAMAGACERRRGLNQVDATDSIRAGAVPSPSPVR